MSSSTPYIAILTLVFQTISYLGTASTADTILSTLNSLFSTSYVLDDIYTPMQFALKRGMIKAQGASPWDSSTCLYYFSPSIAMNPKNTPYIVAAGGANPNSLNDPNTVTCPKTLVNTAWAANQTTPFFKCPGTQTPYGVAPSDNPSSALAAVNFVASGGGFQMCTEYTPGYWNQGTAGVNLKPGGTAFGSGETCFTE